MKKILSILLALATLMSTLALFSCGKTKDGETLQRLATKTTGELYFAEKSTLNNAKYYTITTTRVVTQSEAVGSGKTTETVITKQSGNNGYAKTSNDKIAGSETEAWYIYNESMTYVSKANSKTKFSNTQDSFKKSYLNKNANDLIMLNLDSSDFDEKSFEKSGNYWVIKLVIPKDTYKSAYMQASSSIVNMTALPGSDVEYNVYFDDNGKLVKIVTSYDIDSAGVGSHCEITTEVSLTDPLVNAPADASSYIFQSP